jgi:regulator of replication initiation timing
MDYDELLQKFNLLLNENNRLIQENSRLRAQLGLGEWRNCGVK